jgi:hypothetical protein
MENAFVTLANINVSKHIEKKGNLSYLSWAWAVDQLMRQDPMANWEFHKPKMFGQTMMVSCTVTAFGKPVTMHLPVMDHRNKAVENPDAFVVNKNMMRCLVKAIACHGLGLHIYAGEDLPSEEQRPAPKQNKPLDMDKFLLAINNAKNLEDLEGFYNLAMPRANAEQKETIQFVYDELKATMGANNGK